MFGCYRRDEAADPDTFVAAVTMVLSRYPAAVVDAVTDPFAGLPSRKTERGYSGLPDIADVKEGCENESARLVRMAAYAKLTVQKRLPAPPRPPQATIFTAKGFPHFDKLFKRHEAGEQPSYCETRICVDKVERFGVWTPFSWLEEPAKGAPAGLDKAFKPYTDSELREKYGPKATASTSAPDAAP